MGDVKVFFHSILLMTSQSVQYLIYGNLISHLVTMLANGNTIATVVPLTIWQSQWPLYQVVRKLVTSNGHQLWFKYF